MSENTNTNQLTWKQKVGYGFGDAGGVITLIMVAGYMTRYLQVHLSINPGLLATMLLIWNIWDAINDPLMGTLMDMRFAKAKPGKDKFRPWILWSIPVIVFGMITFFVIPPRLGGMTQLVALFLLKIVYEAGYTMMNIGMGSLLGVMSTNDEERATLASARGFGSTFGQLIAGFLIPQILARFGDNTTGFAIAATVCAILGGFMIFMHYAWTEERNKGAQVAEEKTPEELEAEKVKLTDIFGVFKNNRAFLALILHSICITAVQGMGTGAATYMYFDVLQDVGLQSYAATLGSVTMIVILVMAPFLAKKWDLVTIIRACLMSGMILFAGLLAYSLMVDAIHPWVFVVWNALATGMITMSVQMQWGLVAESIDYNEFLTGKRNEGSIYGTFSLSRRVGSTIAGSATVLIIAAIGYDPELATAGLFQAPETIRGIKLMVMGFPMLAALGSWLSFTFVWNIDDNLRDQITAFKLKG